MTVLIGTPDNETLTGGDGDDSLDGGTGNDTLDGGGGDDTLIGGGSNDTLDGGEGSDTAVFSGNFDQYAITYDPRSGDFTVLDINLFRDGVDVVRRVERFRFNDVVKTAAELQKVIGAGGDDTLTGGDNPEELDGGAGNDTLDGGAGNDTLNGGAGDDTLNGGVGEDLVSYFSASGGVIVDLGSGHSSGADGNDTLINFEDVLGSSYDDTLTGDAGDNKLFGALGNDKLVGGAGKDTLDGGTGADVMEGGSGADTYMVDDIGDLVIEGADPSPNAMGIRSAFALELGKIADLIKASVSYTLPNYVENLTLAAVAGHLSGTGNSLDNILTGNEGNNLMTGAGGNDTIDGGAGLDTAVFSSLRANYTASKVGGVWTVSDTKGSDGTDTLTNIERLRFSDKSLALDLGPSENGGRALEFIGLMAPALITSPSIVGTILGVFDQGKSMKEVCQLALDLGLVNSIAGSGTNAALAAMAFRNLIGAEAGAATVDMLVGYMDGRSASYSQADFMAVVAGLELNQTHIGLVGLQQTGIEFV